MTPALAPLLAALLAAAPPAAPRGKDPVVRHAEEAGGEAPRPIGTAEDLAALCRALAPPERLRVTGDAVARGEAEALHASGRDAAILARYAATLPAGPLGFAPYDGGERRLALAEPVILPVPGSRSRLWPTEEAGLAVEVDAAAARRILDAQRGGRLELQLVFDLPDDATCGSDPRGRAFTLPVEPVEWRWVEGGAVLARGGVARDRPAVSAAQGARPRVEVGEPLAGPASARGAVAARAAALEACYAEALRQDPELDGTLVVALGASPAVAADSTGAPGLGACVQRALAGAAPPGGARAAVPIRFELEGSATAAAPAPDQTQRQ